MDTVQIPAYELKFSDNIQWYGNLYTITALEFDYEDETVELKVGYPRKLEGDNPVLSQITMRLAQQVITYRR